MPCYGMFNEEWHKDDLCDHCMHPDGYETSATPPRKHVVCCKCGRIKAVLGDPQSGCDKKMPFKKWFVGGDSE
jgi:hypothetical protein